MEEKGGGAASVHNSQVCERASGRVPQRPQASTHLRHALSQFAQPILCEMRKRRRQVLYGNRGGRMEPENGVGPGRPTAAQLLSRPRHHPQARKTSASVSSLSPKSRMHDHHSCRIQHPTPPGPLRPHLPARLMHWVLRSMTSAGPGAPSAGSSSTRLAVTYACSASWGMAWRGVPRPS